MSGMPSDLVLVRHGESEGNVALGASKKGDDRYFEIEGFRDRPGHDWRLTDKGKEQAIKAGEKIRQLFPSGFDRYYVSDFARAKETAGLLDLPQARWFLNLYLHEQLWGQMDVVPRSEMAERFPGAQEQRNRHRYYGSFLGGENMGEVCMRCDRVLETLGRECDNKRVILVCHGNVIWAFRMLIERITPYQFHQMDTGSDKSLQIHNGQIFHYTRYSPLWPSPESKSLDWWRTTRPASNTPIDDSWHQITRPSFSNKDILAELSHIPQLISE